MARDLASAWRVIDQLRSIIYGGGWGGTSSTVLAVPAGTIMAYGGAAAPSGWLLCDGTEYHTTALPALYTAIGTAYGSSGAGHFNVPDLRSSFPKGKGGAMSLGDTGGSATHAHELPFQLTGTVLRHLSSATFGTGTSRAAERQNTSVADTTSAAVALSQSVNGEPEWLCVNYIIKT